MEKGNNKASGQAKWPASLRICDDLNRIGLNIEKEIAELVDDSAVETKTRFADCIEEQVFPIIIYVLNSIHGLDWEERQWKIVVGHWIRRAIRVYVSRREELNTIVDRDELRGLSYMQGSLCRKDVLESVLSYSEVAWNKSFYALLDGKIKQPKRTEQEWRSREDRSKYSYLNNQREIFKRFIKKVLLKIGLVIGIYDNYIISEPLLTKQSWTKLVAKLRTAYFTGFSEMTQEGVDYIEKMRSTCEIIASNQCRREKGTSCKKEFLQIVWEMIPTCFMENFESLYRYSKGVTGSLVPKNIITANSFDFNEVFQIWTAIKISEGSRYIVLQHGSNYGTTTIDLVTIEEETSDKFINWGWRSDSRYQKGYISVLLPKRKRRQLVGDVLMVMVHSPQGIDAFDDISMHIKQRLFQKQVYDYLSEELRWRVRLRLHPRYSYMPIRDDLWWEKYRPGIQIERGVENFSIMVDKYRLIIFTYDSCGFLQCLASDRPAMVVMKGLYGLLREEVKKDYKGLERVGIIHTSKTSLEKHLGSMESVENWWTDKNVAYARTNFCARYCNMGPYISKLIDFVS